MQEEDFDIIKKKKISFSGNYTLTQDDIKNFNTYFANMKSTKHFQCLRDEFIASIGDKRITPHQRSYIQTVADDAFIIIVFKFIGYDLNVYTKKKSYRWFEEIYLVNHDSNIYIDHCDLFDQKGGRSAPVKSHIKSIIDIKPKCHWLGLSILLRDEHALITERLYAHQKILNRTVFEKLRDDKSLWDDVVEYAE